MDLVVISGKGGTGKTTIATALSELQKGYVIRVDCDVDAPNFSLYYSGMDIEKKYFYAGKKAVVNKTLCNNCNKCGEVCKFNAIHKGVIDDLSCEGCGACLLVCENNAIKLVDDKTADTYITKLEDSILSRAEMEIGSDGSGKLISYIRKNAKRFDKENSLTIIDGSPGIGCSVISSITGCDVALIVTEPTLSGLQDLKRILSLCQYFNIDTMVCINKYDMNKEMADDIISYIKKENVELVGKIPYDNIVMESINNLKPITEYKDSKAFFAIKDMWEKINKEIFI